MMIRWIWLGLAVTAMGVVGCTGDDVAHETGEAIDHRAPPPPQDPELADDARAGTETIEVTEYHAPPPRQGLDLVDDTLAEPGPAFDETLVDSRPVTSEQDGNVWEVNQSAAVIRLDCPMIRPDYGAWLLELRPSYAAAMRAAEEHHATVLLSANLLDGAAKQFDDGLYAAVDLACYRGELGLGISPQEWVAAVLGRLPEASLARPFLAAALELAGRPVELPPAMAAEKQRLLAVFDADEIASKPIAFYNWTPELQQVWRFFRFLQQPLGSDTAGAVADVLEADAGLLGQYKALVAFYSRLTNPAICLPVDALIGTDASPSELACQRGARRPVAAVLPQSTSREVELFDQLFPQGLRDGANLMVELIRRIRSGDVDLAPGKKDGWYQYQVYALQAILLPGESREHEKLLLTAAYKRRLVEAFKALVTKRRETHVRQLAIAGPLAAPAPPEPLSNVRPRLRIEPCATFYLRTARAYAFLENFLQAAAGAERLAALHALRPGGPREPSLADELAAMRRRFYGFYLVACEDVGMQPSFLPDEPVDEKEAMTAALTWLSQAASDPDLARDVRVAVPIYGGTGSTRLWVTLGVRLAWLEASYARGPRVRVKGGNGPWEEVPSGRLTDCRYVIAVDEFAEIERSGLTSLTRDELRRVCDKYKTREAILTALQK